MTTLLTPADFSDRVAAGIAFINSVNPHFNWWSINLDHLDIGSQYMCVLGQIYGGFFDGLHATGMNGNDASRHGFVYWNGETTIERMNMSALNTAWREAIEKERHGNSNAPRDSTQCMDSP